MAKGRIPWWDQWGWAIIILLAVLVYIAAVRGYH